MSCFRSVSATILRRKEAMRGCNDFLSRSSGPEAEKAREIVEALYSVFPDPNGALLGALSSGPGHEAGDHFYGALGSLWLYSHLQDPGVLITTDEETPGSDKRPDLRLSSHTGEELLAVEITAIANDAATSTADWNFETLVSRINAGVSREGVYLSLIRKGAWTQTPPVGKMVATIEREVDSLLCNQGAIDPNARELGKLRATRRRLQRRNHHS